jgi:WD40 repeat protein
MFKKSFIPLLARATLASSFVYLVPPTKTAIAQNWPNQLTAQSSQGQMNPTELKGFNGTIISLAISPDGQYLYGGGEDKTIKIWNLGQ